MRFPGRAIFRYELYQALSQPFGLLMLATLGSCPIIFRNRYPGVDPFFSLCESALYLFVIGAGAVQAGMGLLQNEPYLTMLHQRRIFAPIALLRVVLFSMMLLLFCAVGLLTSWFRGANTTPVSIVLASIVLLSTIGALLLAHATAFGLFRAFGRNTQLGQVALIILLIVMLSLHAAALLYFARDGWHVSISLWRAAIISLVYLGIAGVLNWRATAFESSRRH